MASNFLLDSNKEQIVHEYLEKFLYPNIINIDGTPVKYTPYADEFHQKQGIDIELDWDKTKLIIDEKSATDYLNFQLDTFVLELSFLSQNGNRVLGWYLRDDLQTKYYLFCWLKCYNNKLEKVDDIEFVDCALVEKARLRNSKIESLQYNTLIKYCYDTTLFSQETKYKTAPFNNKTYLTYSPQKDEKPINLVVKKEIYSHYAKFYCRITKNGLKLLK